MNDDMDMRPYVGFEESLCSPADVLALLLSLIAPDGSVCLSYDSGSADPLWEMIPPHAPLPLSDFADQVYEARLIHVARLLFHLCQQINALRLPDTDPLLRIAAVEITAYQHDSTFLHKALALIPPRKYGGWTQPPRLPDPALHPY